MLNSLPLPTAQEIIFQTEKEILPIIELPKKPHKDILCHVYRAKEGKPDQEGNLIPLALALLIKYQMEMCEGEWEAPNIIFGADLRSLSNGIPLYDIYANQFRKELELLGLPENCCNIYTSGDFYRHPVGTLTELTSLRQYQWIMYDQCAPKAMCFSREPHQDRIKYLAKTHGIDVDYLSAEQVIIEILGITGEDKKSIKEKYFTDTETFRNAEGIKMKGMRAIDQRGLILELISYIPKFKNWLLDVGGHKS